MGSLTRWVGAGGAGVCAAGVGWAGWVLLLRGLATVSLVQRGLTCHVFLCCFPLHLPPPACAGGAAAAQRDAGRLSLSWLGPAGFRGSCGICVLSLL